jgi:hypothetical protein
MPRHSTLAPNPPKPMVENGGGGSGWRLLTVAKDQYTAALIEGRLLQDEIETFLEATHSQHGAFLKPFGDPMAPVRLFVKDRDYETACLILHLCDTAQTAPATGGRLRVRGVGLPLFTIATVIVAAVLAFLEIFDFAPCAIRAFCL